jgi:putative pyruvate formate lyase activating enzyme
MIMNLNYREPLYLERYLGVMRDRLPSQFLISRSICVDFDRDSPVQELWGMHDEAMKSFRERKERINSIKELPPFAASSLLDVKVAIANKILENCYFCERRCGANRKKKKTGHCRLDAVSRYSAEFLHQGEEPELVPSHTIFFTGCNFTCVYCQNWDISQAPQSGIPILPQELARIITLRRAYGSRNVNFVTPTPHTHTILKILNALKVNVPVVWNSNMYYSNEIAALLEGIVDVYLGDLRYGNDDCAKRYSNVPDYWGGVTRNFMTAYTGGEILLRQLVLPGHLDCCTAPIVKWVKENIPKVRFNLMFQYRPNYRAYEYPEINRSLMPVEIQKALEIVRESELEDVLI